MLWWIHSPSFSVLSNLCSYCGIVAKLKICKDNTRNLATTTQLLPDSLIAPVMHSAMDLRTGSALSHCVDICAYRMMKSFEKIFCGYIELIFEVEVLPCYSFVPRLAQVIVSLVGYSRHGNS